MFFFFKGMKKELLLGQKFRHKQLKNYKNCIPGLNEIACNGFLNLERWFDKYIYLINFGARQFKEIKKNKKNIKLIYTCYSNSKKEEFTNYLPLKIKTNKEFLYFFGLWCGDRVGKGRFGVVNKEKILNFITRDYLIKLYQKPHLILKVNKGIKIPKLDYVDEIYIDNHKTKIKGYAIYVYSKNAIMFKFFDYLLSNLDLFLSKINKREIFFAGLFDAEGNVSLEDSYFRWACKNEKLVKIYKKYLTEMSLFDRYDKCCLITKNKNIFFEKIYPYIKHPSKINRTKLVCLGEGFLEHRYKNILNYIRKNPGITQNDLAKCLKRAKVYAHLILLERLNYIERKNYPKMNFITLKGEKELNERVI